MKQPGSAPTLTGLNFSGHTMTNNADAPGAQDKKRKFTSVKMDWLDRLLSQVDGNTFKVGFAISKHLNERTGECFPSIERIAAVTGLSRSAVNRAIDKLREGGWINSHRTRGPSVYSIRDVSPAAHQMYHQRHF